MSIIWHNGAFLDDTQPVINIHDRIRLGEGVFNTVLVIDGQLFHAKQHMGNVLKNARLFWQDWQAPHSDVLIETANDLLKKNGFLKGRFALNTFITGGAAGNGVRTPNDQAPQIMMRALACPSEFSPVRAIIANTVRRNEGSPLSQIKCSQYGDNILAMKEAEQRAANEAILLNNAGHVTCATTSNIVIEKDGAFITPPLHDGVLNGVTRGCFLKAYDVTERSITADDLLNANGIYLLNSLRGTVPVIELDGKAIAAPSVSIPQFFHLDFS